MSVLRIEFKSDLIINKGIGFEAVFSIGELLIYVNINYVTCPTKCLQRAVTDLVGRVVDWGSTYN